MNVTSLQNHFLIAHDNHPDDPFYKTVVYICQHNDSGTMGLVINRRCGLIATELFSALEIVLHDQSLQNKPVLCGGPVQEDVGFVIHTDEGQWESSFDINENVTVTTSKDIMQAIADAHGPKNSLFLLGYSGWEPHQLEQELERNVWLTCPASEEILFNTPIEQRWDAAIHSLGIDPSQLVHQTGHA